MGKVPIWEALRLPRKAMATKQQRPLRAYAVRTTLGALAVILLLTYFATWAAKAFAIRPERVPVQYEGSIARNGHNRHLGEPAGFPRPRLWGTHLDDDAKTGSLRMGPLVVEGRIRLFLCGYPNTSGISLGATRTDNGEKIPLKVKVDPGEEWQLHSFELPASWQGTTITIDAEDRATGHCGWLGLSEPLSFFVSEALAQYLLCFLVVVVIVAPLFILALAFLGAKDWVAPHWEFLLASAFVCLFGYLLFWLTFLLPLVGKSAALLATVLAWAVVLRKRGVITVSDEARRCARLFVLAGILFLVAMAWHNGGSDFSRLAQNRYVYGLPGDNGIPGEFARMIQEGREAKYIGTDWLTSDRPPLQTSFLSLILPLTDCLGMNSGNVSGVAGMCLQLLWMPALFGMMQELGLSTRRAMAATCALAFTGFFALHTVFVWPKLLAAAFALGAFSLWVVSPRRTEFFSFVLGALFAALAWLSHGGIAFSLIGLIPWLIARLRRSTLRSWAFALVCFALIAAPWIAFQKCYAPPANRLLKWHLAGQIAIDSRSFGQTLVDAYRSRSWAEHWQNKSFNFRAQLGEAWDNAIKGGGDMKGRRHSEFFLTARAVGLWLLGIPLLVWAILWGRFRAQRTAHLHLLGWTVLSYLVWCIMMFNGGQAVVHQGSYAAILGLFAMGAMGFATLSQVRWALIILIQILYFIATWWGPTLPTLSVVNPLAVGIAVLSFGAVFSACSDGLSNGAYREGAARRPLTEA
jgi:hypothetical protein